MTDEIQHRNVLSRRSFLARTAMVGGGAAIAGWGISPWVGDVFHRRGTFVYPDRPPTFARVRTVYSVCKQCGSDCGLAANVFAGVLQKLDGNPYHPACTEPHARYATPLRSAKVWATPHSLCNRGQAGRQTVYDPYRLTMPLKRSGPRGSGQWEVISWDTLIREVVDGGYLFAHLPGEEHRHVDGFSALWDEGRGRFHPIDPNDPSLGPQTNGLVIYYGMAENGQVDFLSRFASSFGTVNLEAADAICDLNRMQATMLSLDGMTDPLKPDLANATYIIFFGTNVMTGGFPMQALGRKLAEAVASGKLSYTVVDVRTNNASLHSSRSVYVRPGGDGALAMGMIRWILEHRTYDEEYLSLPNQQAALTAGMPNFTNATWLVVVEPDHPSFGDFLTPNQAGISTGMSAMTASSGTMDTGVGSTGVVIDPITREPTTAATASAGLLWPTGLLNVEPVRVNGVQCMTSFQLLYREALAYEIEEYAKEAGVTAELIATLAAEFTSHGRTAVADFGRGPTMHTNGFYTGRAIMTLNFLVGNVDWMGGYVVGGGTADYIGANSGAPYNLGSWPGQPSNIPTGVPLSRSGVAYETSKEYASRLKAGKKPYPARRPWFPFGGGQWPEMFAGIYEGYPYKAKILIQHAANPAWSAPAIGGADDPSLPWHRLVKDVEKVPLFIAIDTVISESSAYADYIVPDTTYLECWEFPGVWPIIPTKVQGIRQPVIDPLTARTPTGEPMSMEQFLIDVAKTLKLPGFGKGAFIEGGSLDTREDYYLKMVANIAYDSTYQAWRGGELITLGPVPDATHEELDMVSALKLAHRRALTDAQWRKVAYVLARGGRFEDYEAAYLPNVDSQTSLARLVNNLILDTGVDGWVRPAGQIIPAKLRSTFLNNLRFPGVPPSNPRWMSYRYGQGGNACQLYNPAVATARNAITGEQFCGTARYARMRDMAGHLLDELDPSSRFPLVLTTHKTTVISHSQSISDPWLVELMPEGFIEISPADAARLGLREGDEVRVWSNTFPHKRGVVGRIRLLSGVRVGIVAFPHGYGHWCYGSGTWTVDGRSFTGDTSRNAPVRLNAVMRLDTSIAAPDGWSIGCMDPVTGGQAYFETRVAIERV